MGGKMRWVPDEAMKVDIQKMVLSTATRPVRPSDMRMRFAVPLENLDYAIETHTTLVFDLNVICMLVNYVVQHCVIIWTADRSIGKYEGELNWVTFAAALISCIGTLASLIAKRNRPPHKGRWFNFLVALELVACTGYALAVHGDPRPLGSLTSTMLLYVTKANSQKKEERFVLGDRRLRGVPIAGFRALDGVIDAALVSAEHAHLVDSLYQGGQNIVLSVSSGEGAVTVLNMRED